MKTTITEGQNLTKQQREKYDSFVHSHPLGSIHQLTDWGLFQAKSGRAAKFWVVEILDENANLNNASPPKPTSKILASALILRHNLPLKKCWLYSPRGPLLDYSNSDAAAQKIAAEMFKAIAELARTENAIFFRFDPGDERSESQAHGNQNGFPEPQNTSKGMHVHTIDMSQGSRPAHAHYQPESTLIIDLTPPAEAILAQMKPKGRYNIKVAQKHNVKIRLSNEENNTTAINPATPTQSANRATTPPRSTSASLHPNTSPPYLSKDLIAFYELLTQTTFRDGFHGHPIKYYRDMLATLGSKKAKLYLAEYTTPAANPNNNHTQNSTEQIFAAAIVTYFNDTATYYFGASSNAHRNVMAPYLLHWQIMQDAKKAGYKFYDLFGISPEARQQTPSSFGIWNSDSVRHLLIRNLKFSPKPHPWATVTDFKLKFGGTRTNYQPAREVVYKPFWFTAMRLVKFIVALSP